MRLMRTARSAGVRSEVYGPGVVDDERTGVDGDEKGFVTIVMRGLGGHVSSGQGRTGEDDDDRLDVGMGGKGRGWWGRVVLVDSTEDKMEETMDGEECDDDDDDDDESCDGGDDGRFNC